MGPSSRAGIPAGRDLYDRINCSGAFLRGDDGIDIYGYEPRPERNRQMRETRQHFRKRVDMHTVLAAHARQDRGTADRRDHLTRFGDPEGATAQDDVLQHLDIDAAEAEHGNGAENRIPLDTHDAFDTALDPLGDQHTVDARTQRR